LHMEPQIFPCQHFENVQLETLEGLSLERRRLGE
jgi:hypothetical protein